MRCYDMLCLDMPCQFDVIDRPWDAMTCLEMPGRRRREERRGGEGGRGNFQKNKNVGEPRMWRTRTLFTMWGNCDAIDMPWKSEMQGRGGGGGEE